MTETACCFLEAACGDVGSEARDEWMGEVDVKEYRILRTCTKVEVFVEPRYASRQSAASGCSCRMIRGTP